MSQKNQKQSSEHQLYMQMVSALYEILSANTFVDKLDDGIRETFEQGLLGPEELVRLAADVLMPNNSMYACKSLGTPIAHPEKAE